MNSGMGPNFGFGPQMGSQFGGFNGYNQFGPTNFAPPGFSQPSYFPATNWGGGYGFTPPANAWMGPAAMGWGLGGARTWGGTYSPQFLSTGLPTDSEIVEMCYDAMDDDPVIPFDAEINVDSDAGTVTLTGTVHSKLVKHAAGDDAWWIPGVDDVHNELRVVAPQRSQTGATGRSATQPKAPSTTPRATRTTTPSGTGTTSRNATPGTRSRGASATGGTTSRGATTGTARPTTPRGASTGTTKTGGTTSRSATAGTTGTTGTQSTAKTAATGTKEKTVANARPTMRSTTGTNPTNPTNTSNPTGRTGTRAASGTRRAGAA